MEAITTQLIPRPPRLPWMVVLALTLITFGIFYSIWLLVQADWARHVRGRSVAFWLSVVSVGLIGINLTGGLLPQNVLGVLSDDGIRALAWSLVFTRLLARLLALVTVFVLRSELQAFPIDLPVSAGMTLFFGPIYFQYLFNLLNDPDRGERHDDILSIAPTAFSSISPVMSSEEHGREHERPYDPAHDIFVFGSNEEGHHYAGAAAYAVERAGAKWGNGIGRTGNAYGVVTMSGLPRIREEVAHFIDYAKAHPELSFFVTRVGCGIAGFQDNAIAPLFKDAPQNCLLPLGWRDLAELRAGLEPSPKVY